ncbi:DUF4148 domain-containing protein [Pseudorhodoferax sp. Leaf274]|uniref:DUF4148 domain-containing protein n=1 Tax=Pseudorhodoferax sp. Leaf274 TaxID=1736318 RepID=UPI0007039C7B|nr:DUF4148 domain-containing protein [Pseudorhodoferax sp. Leaf274]KQP38935.1 hypothetical protein ASF44_10895 [Pseudorhodoferax sp. Leaf274]
MNTQWIASAWMAAAFVATPCLADVHASGEVGYIPPVASAPSTLTRAEVLAQLEQAQREGTLPPTAEGADIGAVAAPQQPTLLAAQPTLAAR